MLTPTAFRRWSQTIRDVVLLSLLALAARLIAALLVDYPPYTDPAYYTLVAARLAEGHGFSVPVIWSFLEVGGSIPPDPRLPVPSNGHWMPLTSIVSGGAMWLLGSSWRAGQIPTVALSAALVPMTYLVARHLWPARRDVALAAAVLAVFTGPLLLMYPTIDNFAVFGVAGAGALYASTRAVTARRPGRWLVLAGAAAGLATLARIDGALLMAAPATAWLVGRGRWPGIGRSDPGGEPRPDRWSYGAAFGAMASFALVLAPWLARNLAVFGRPLPSAGGHTLWITTYNEQFSIGHEVTPGSYLEWGVANIVGSKLEAWYELLGRTSLLLGGTFLVFFLAGLWIERRRAQLAPFVAYFGVMFVAMGAVFTFHAPKGAFYHSAPAWLPFALPLAVASVGPAASAAGRVWPFLRRPATHRFLVVTGLAGAVALSLVSSAALRGQWERSRERETAVADFFIANGLTGDVVMYSDPASLNLLSGNPGVAAPFDPYPVVERVVRSYDVRWVVVTLGDGATVDPLGLWHGSASRDADGNRATWLASRPAFETGDVRIFQVRTGTIGSP